MSMASRVVSDRILRRAQRIQRSVPNGSDMHVDSLLTGIAGSYWQQFSGVSSLVFPTVPVLKQTGKIGVYNKGDLNRIEAKARAAGAPAARGGYRVTTSTTYECVRYDLGMAVIDDDRSNADLPFDLERDAIAYCLQNVALRKEKAFAAAAFTTSIWTTQKNGGGGDFTQWNATNATPIENIRAWKSDLKEACGNRPNTLVFGADAWDEFIDHPTVVDRLKHTSSEPISRAIVARLLEVDNVHVFDVVETTSKEGAATTTLAQVGNAESLLLCYVSPNPSPMMPSAGYTLSWTGSGSRDQNGIRSKRYRVEEVEGDVIEVSGAWDHKVVAADMGLFAYDILA